MDISLKELLRKHKIIHLEKNLLDFGINNVALAELLEADEDIQLIVPNFIDKLRFKALLRELKPQSMLEDKENTIILEPNFMDIDYGDEFHDQSNDAVTMISEVLSPSSETSSSIHSSDNIVTLRIPRQKKNIDINFEKFTELMNQNYGKTIIEFYKINGCLDARMRNLVTGYLISCLVTCIESSLKSTTMAKIAEYIERMFPTESKETYFLLSKNSNKVIYSGKLYCKYKNHRHFLLTASKCIHESSIEPELPISTEENSKVNWLCNNTVPFEKVTKLWKETFAIRRRKNGSEHIKNITYDFPALKLENGFMLVCSQLNEVI